MHYCRALPQLQEFTLTRELPLPNQPLWFPRIPALLQNLRAESAPAEFTRADLERLLGVRRRRAILLLHRLAAPRRAGVLVATRASLIAYLEQAWNEDAAEQAVVQTRHVSEALALARRALLLPSIPLPPPAKLSEITFDGLPAGIRLTRTELAVAFSSAQDLLEKLFTLAQAFANDYESLESALETPQPPEGAGR